MRYVVTRSPMRVSYFGGGTDFESYFSKSNAHIFSVAIDQYIYVTLKQHGGVFDEPYRLNYSQTEEVDKISDIKNDIIRECLFI